MSERTFKISSVADLRVAKERYRYEAKLQEQHLMTGVKQFKSSVKEAAKNTFREAVQKLIYLTLLNIMKNRMN